MKPVISLIMSEKTFSEGKTGSYASVLTLYTGWSGTVAMLIWDVGQVVS